MTETSDTIRAGFLIVVMVVSAFGGTVALTGTAGAEVDSISAVDAENVVAEDSTAIQNVTFDVGVNDTAEETVSIAFDTGNVRRASVVDVSSDTGVITADNATRTSDTTVSLDVNGSADGDGGTVTVQVEHDLTGVRPADGVSVTVDDSGGTDDAGPAGGSFDVLRAVSDDDPSVNDLTVGEDSVSTVGGSTDVVVNTADNDQAFVYLNVTTLAENGVDLSSASAGTVTASASGDSAGSTRTVSSDSGVTVFYFSVTDGNDDGVVTVTEANVTGLGTSDVQDVSGLTYDLNATMGSTSDSAFDSSNGNAPGTDDLQTGTFSLVKQSGSDNPDAEPSGERLYFQGQVIHFRSEFDANDDIQLRRNTSDGGSAFVRQLTADSSGSLNLTTTELAPGDYYIDDDGSVAFSWEIAAQSLSVSAEDGTVDNAGGVTETHGFDTNRGGEFAVEVSATADGDAVDNETLRDVFNDSQTVTGVDSETVELVAGDGSEVEANFTGVEAGDYTITFDVADTTASDTAQVAVDDVGTGELELAADSVEVDQGDVAEITVDMSGAATEGTLVVGDEDAGYQANVSVTDADDDGQVTVLFDTYAAGSDDIRPVVAAETDDSGDDDTATLDNADGSLTELNALLDDGEYELAVSTGDSEATESQPDDLGTLFVAERSTSGQQLWTAPGGVDDFDADDSLDGDDVATLIEDGSLTRDDTVAGGDYVVHQVRATGLEGVFENSSSAFAALNSSSLDVSVEQTNPGRNADPKVLNLTASEDAVTVIEGDGAFYVVVDTDEAVFDRDGRQVGAANGEAFDATVSVTDDRLLGSDDAEESVSATFEVVEPTVAFGGDTVEVSAAENRTVSGTTSVAPGTEFTVQIRSDGGVQPRFFDSQTVTVRPDGSFSAAFDLSEQSAGDTFGVSTSDAPASASADGEVVAVEETTTETTETTAETATGATETATETTTETTTRATAEPDTTTETTTTESTGPGFGAVVAVVALAAATLLATRREG